MQRQVCRSFHFFPNQTFIELHYPPCAVGSSQGTARRHGCREQPILLPALRTVEPWKHALNAARRCHRGPGRAGLVGSGCGSHPAAARPPSPFPASSSGAAALSQPSPAARWPCSSLSLPPRPQGCQPSPCPRSALASLRGQQRCFSFLCCTAPCGNTGTTGMLLALRAPERPF